MVKHCGNNSALIEKFTEECFERLNYNYSVDKNLSSLILVCTCSIVE